MTPVARLSAAIDILEDIFTRHRPVASALKDWGKSHRFAGSGDRTVIGNLVFDVLRRKGMLSWIMDSDAPRALVLALYGRQWSTPENLLGICTGDSHSPAPLNAAEAAGIAKSLEGAPPHVIACQQEWLFSRLLAVYTPVQNIVEGAALAGRAPIDLRINTLRGARDKTVGKLDRFHAMPTPLSPVGIRVPYGSGEQRSPSVETDDLYQRGIVELQDEGSQLVTLLIGAKPGEQVLDYCAGAGGKALGLSAMMENRGQIVATDNDPHRLMKIYDRLKRAQARNVQVKRQDELPEFEGRMDKVVLDVPCTGTGAWRRRPDNKWRLNEETLQKRVVEQGQILQKSASFVRKGGELAYITCSLLREENEAQIEAFLHSETGSAFKLVDMPQRWSDVLQTPLPPQPIANCGVRLSPGSTGTDGFFIACMARKA